LLPFIIKRGKVSCIAKAAKTVWVCPNGLANIYDNHGLLYSGTVRGKSGEGGPGGLRTLVWMVSCSNFQFLINGVSC